MKIIIREHSNARGFPNLELNSYLQAGDIMVQIQMGTTGHFRLAELLAACNALIEETSILT